MASKLQTKVVLVTINAVGEGGAESADFDKSLIITIKTKAGLFDL
jgi:hypothetical protein